jgi:hypothetical protein
MDKHLFQVPPSLRDPTLRVPDAIDGRATLVPINLQLPSIPLPKISQLQAAQNRWERSSVIPELYWHSVACISPLASVT